MSDSSFNGGVPSVADSNGANGGWSIEYNPAVDGYVKDCVIYTGIGNNCDLTGATKVGETYLNPNFVHFCIDYLKYQANEFYLYAGQCVANDMGDVLDTGVCSQPEIAQFARAVETYPLVNTGGNLTVNFTYKKTDAINPIWGDSYKVFPLDGTTKKFLTAVTCVSPQDTPLDGTFSQTAEDVLKVFGVY